MDSLKEAIMRRYRLSETAAKAWIEEARMRVREGDDPFEILHEEFGLEPDYVFDLLY